MNNLDLCPKCKTYNLKQIYLNHFKCLKCGFTEEQNLYKCVMFKNTIIKPCLENYKGVKSKMTEERSTVKPKYIGNGVAIWENTDKNGKTYLSVSVLGGKAINCFELVEKDKQ